MSEPLQNWKPQTVAMGLCLAFRGAFKEGEVADVLVPERVGVSESWAVVATMRDGQQFRVEVTAVDKTFEDYLRKYAGEGGQRLRFTVTEYRVTIEVALGDRPSKVFAVEGDKVTATTEPVQGGAGNEDV